MGRFFAGKLAHVNYYYYLCIRNQGNGVTAYVLFKHVSP